MSKVAKGGVVIDFRYRLTHEIGSGNMGVVWAAIHLKLGYLLAVKLLQNAEQASHDTVVRFEREACAGAVLGAATEHAARTYEYGCDAVYGPYFTMELVEGMSLERHLSVNGPLSARKAAAFLKHIARALRQAHAKGIVIRDVKPSNVMVSQRPGEDLRIVLIDFGVVKHLPPGSGPAYTLIAGTPTHMSRELIRGEPIDERADLWSTAVILYEMLTGRLPFVGNDFDQVKKAIHVGDVVPPSRVVRRLGPRFDAFFERAFAADITQRFANIDELEAAFSSSARPTSPPSGGARTSRRSSVPPSRRRPAGTLPAAAPRSAAGSSSKARTACATIGLTSTLRSPVAPQRGSVSAGRTRRTR